MNTTFIVSLAGKSRPGLLQDLAHFTHEHGGKWLSSKVSHLEGHLAAILKIELPEAQLEAVQNQFKAQANMSVQFDLVNDVLATPASQIRLVIDAKDRLGLIKEITNTLDEQNVTVIEMECARLNVTGLGTSVFTANLELGLPEGCQSNDVIDNLKSLGDDIVVKVA